MHLDRCLLFGTALAAASCRSATPAASPATQSTDAVIAYSKVDTTRVPIDVRTQLAAFNLEVPLPTDTGVCVRRPVPMGIGELVSLYYPGVRNAVAVAAVNVDSAGHIIRYSERRGEVNFKFSRPLRGQELDSAITAARQRTRSSSIYLDYDLGHATLANEGGGRRNQSVLAPLTAVANDPRFGAPDARAHAIVARCGAVPMEVRGVAPTVSVPTGARPYFEFQVDRQAEYTSGTSVSPHPSRTGSGALVQFVVDSSGAVRPETFKVLRMNDESLVADARKVLAQWRFTPAEVGGRKVSQLVQTEIER